jgi:predicted RNA-binding protein
MVVYEDEYAVVFDWKTFATDECHLVKENDDKEQYVMFTNLEKAAGTYIMHMQAYKEKYPTKEIKIKHIPLAWIPLIHMIGLSVDLETVDQSNYVFGGKMTAEQLTEWTIKCEKEGTLRDLIEIMSSADEKLADTLYQLDNFRKIDLDFPTDNKGKDLKRIHQNNWQSYGRSYIKDMHKRIIDAPIEKRKLLMLPCTKSRPYYQKQALYKSQKDGDFKELFENTDFLKVVVSNIGVIPENFWEEKPVMTYSAGVPDIWLIYRMMKDFLTKNKKTIDEIGCYVEFPPYIEIIEILTKELDIPVRFEVKKKYKQKGQKFAMCGV